MPNQEVLKTALRSIGRAIREARSDMKLTQQQFAELCGLNDTYIGCVERGEKNVTYESLQKIARALKLKPSWLLTKADQ